jgi:hypothetical protein
MSRPIFSNQYWINLSIWNERKKEVKIIAKTLILIILYNSEKCSETGIKLLLEYIISK